MKYSLSKLSFVLIVCLFACSGFLQAEAEQAPVAAEQAPVVAEQAPVAVPGAVEGTEASAKVEDPAPKPMDPNHVVAKINGQPIFFHEVEKRVDNFEKKFQEVNPAMKLPEDKRVKMRQDFLDRMVRERILEQAAEKGKFQVTDTEIDERINQLQKIFGEGEEARQRFLSGISDMADFRNNIAKQIRIDKYLETVQKDQIQEVTEAEITEFYNKDLERFKKQESVEIQQINWRLPPKEDASYAEKLATAMAAAEAVMKESQSGKDFTELAKAHSQDAKAAENGGKVVSVERKQLNQQLEDVVFNLAVGEISKPVTTDTGIYVIKALSRQEARTLPLDEVRETIREGLIRNKQGQSREKIYQDLKAAASVEILL